MLRGICWSVGYGLSQGSRGQAAKGDKVLVYYNSTQVKLDGDVNIMSPEVAKDLIRRIEIAIDKVESSIDNWIEAIKQLVSWDWSITVHATTL